MLVRTAANIAPDATWTQLLTLWPWPSFKDASLEAAFQAFTCLFVVAAALHSQFWVISTVFNINVQRAAPPCCLHFAM